jgi:hypothetical protein
VAQRTVSDPVQNHRPDHDLPPVRREIFRAEARHRYQQEQAKVVLPRTVSPRFFIYLWLMAGALMAVGLILAFWPLMG